MHKRYPFAVMSLNVLNHALSTLKKTFQHKAARHKRSSFKEYVTSVS